MKPSISGQPNPQGSLHAVVGRIGAWLCARVGHGALKCLEEYERTEKERHTLGCGRTLTYAPHIQATIKCKWQCERCGTVGVGNVTQLRWH